MGIRNDLCIPTAQSCDYTVDPPTLFTRIAVDLIRMSGDLEPLIGRRGEGSDLEGLPSWAVDWSGRRGDSHPTSDFWTWQKRWHQRGYTADRGIRGVGDGTSLAYDRALVLSGLYADKVAVIEERGDQCDDSQGTTPEILLSGGDRWGKLITQFRESLHPRFTMRSDWMRAFLGLVTGRLLPNDPNDGEDLDAWTREVVKDQAVFIAEDGRFVLGPLNTEAGQELCVVGGCRNP